MCYLHNLNVILITHSRERIPSVTKPHSLRRKIRLKTAFLLVPAIAITATFGSAQLPTAPSSGFRFEVASVKPSPSCGRTIANPGMLSICGTLQSLIKTAYITYAKGQRHASQLFRIEGAPGWIPPECYQINAKAEGTPTVGSLSGPILQGLLEDRFKLKVCR